MATIFWGFGKTLFSGMFEAPEETRAVQDYLSGPKYTKLDPPQNA